MRFYGNENERGWVLESAVIPFDAHETYDQLIERVVREHRRDRKTFIIPPNRRRAWDIAVAAAESAYMMPRQKRIEAWIHESKTDDAKKELVVTKPETGKSSVKKEFVNEKHDSKSKKSEPIKLIAAEDVDSKCSLPTARIKLPKNASNQQIAQFTVFCQKRRNSVQNEFPEATEEHIESILVDQWNRLDDDTKRRFIPMGSDVTNLSQIMIATAGEGDFQFQLLSSINYCQPLSSVYKILKKP